ncbi:MAG: type II toxin-antitoxin system PemK/MazF family toxin [Tepidiformaceae bacterium]
MRRSEVFDVDFGEGVGSEQAWRRPAVVVSRESLNDATGRVTVIPFTTDRPGRGSYPTWVRVAPPDGGLPVASIALCEQIRTVSKDRVFRHRGVLGDRAMAAIDVALAHILGLGRAPSDA